MSTSYWFQEMSAPRLCVYVVKHARTAAGELMASANQLGYRSYTVDLAGARRRADLVRRLSVSIGFPYPVEGLDAALDLLSGLDDGQDYPGYVILIENTDAFAQMDEPGFVAFCSLIPNLLWRWSAGITTLHLIMEARTEEIVRLIESGVAQGNDFMQAALRPRESMPRVRVCGPNIDQSG